MTSHATHVIALERGAVLTNVRYGTPGQDGGAERVVRPYF